ncbi:MAG: hypothetical protein II934_09060 [Prevotella sp.]|nr:hypothetical protein [Prevotella sp.]
MISFEDLSLVFAIIDIIVAIVFGTLNLKSSNNKEKGKGNIVSSTVLDLCMSFQRDIIREYVSVKNFHAAHKLNLIGNIYVDKKNGIVHKPKKMKKNSDIFLQKVMFLFNEMDMFAANLLMEEPENEYQAYRIQGHAYCDIIEDLKGIYDFFLYTHRKDYLHLAKLYDIWSVRN